MNQQILAPEVQAYINSHLTADVQRIAMAKSPFPDVSAMELANQIAAKKKCEKKLPTWYSKELIFYPALLSIEQCSSETTAAYKAKLVTGKSVIDLTGGFGVDSYYFAQVAEQHTYCELNPELAEIAAYNFKRFNQQPIRFLNTDGIAWLAQTEETFDTIYIDPARRNGSGKVFMLKDCTPNVVEHLELLLAKTKRLIIKTAPLLDLTAGLKELNHVAEIHIVSVKNEVKELLWIIDPQYSGSVKIKAVTLNTKEKTFEFYKEENTLQPSFIDAVPEGYLYEPDAALLKSGAFDLIAERFQLKKLDAQTQLYCSDRVDKNFPGRIFEIIATYSMGELKKQTQLTGNVIVRNYPDKAENLVKKYKIRPDDHHFLVFTRSKKDGYSIIHGSIIQHY